jgi:hypothetical protein
MVHPTNRDSPTCSGWIVQIVSVHKIDHSTPSNKLPRTGNLIPDHEVSNFTPPFVEVNILTE